MKGDAKDFICPEGSWSPRESESWSCPGPEGSHGASRAVPSPTRAHSTSPSEGAQAARPREEGKDGYASSCTQSSDELIQTRVQNGSVKTNSTTVWAA